MRKRTSVIWKLDSDKLKELVKSSKNYSQILGYFGLKNIGGNNRTLKERLEKEHIDDSHIKTWIKTRLHSEINLIPIEKILVKNSKYSNRRVLKKRLISEGLLKNICAKCGLPPTWQGEKLVLVLDHKNGIRDDNSIENLWLLCPNCNSQTKTFCRRTKGVPMGPVV